MLGHGSIVNANANSSTDLFKALKGGSNNFGIVTRSDLQTFAATQGGLYAGLLYMDYDTNKDAVLQQLIRLIDINEEHRSDTETVSSIYTNREETPSIVVQLILDDLNTLIPGSGYTMTLVFQPLPKYFASVSASAGARQGNSLGLSGSVTANSFIFLAETKALTIRDEAVINQKLAALAAELEAYAAGQDASTL